MRIYTDPRTGIKYADYVLNGKHVRGIDTPELKSKDPEEKAKAARARAYTRKFLNSGPIRLKGCTRDKYFRLRCDVYVNDYSLAERLLTADLAIPYNGGTK